MSLTGCWCLQAMQRGWFLHPELLPCRPACYDEHRTRLATAITALLAATSEAAGLPSSCRPVDGRAGCICVLHAAARVRQVKVKTDQQHYACRVDGLYLMHC
jgi:hypothetical protein